MTDYDVPVVAFAPPPLQPETFIPQHQHYTKPTLTDMGKGRSRRVVVPHMEQKVLSDNEINVLKQQGFTQGLINAIQRNNHNFPLRVWVVDNSGSMAMGDGHRMIETLSKTDVKLVSCSRWSEIQETVNYHVQMAALLQAPTVFRLLNDPGRVVGPQQFSVGERGPAFIREDADIALETMSKVTPSGVTPLARHVREIRQNIMAMHEELMQNGTKVAIILATDGLPSDITGVSNKSTRTDFENALRSLEGLPVWVVVRLCTDEEEVVDYYNNLDEELELSLEVLDDFLGEAQEVCENNPWLNYALPLHRIREMGFNHRLFDMLDERQLSLDELRGFMFLLFGEENFDGVPDPQVDFNGFMDRISDILKHEKNQWNPMKGKMTPWINVKKLKKTYKKKGCTIM